MYNGTEFHSFAALEEPLSTGFYFVMPHHAWERSTNENTNGLVRQYVPKRVSMAPALSTAAIGSPRNSAAGPANGYRTPEECYVP